MVQDELAPQTYKAVPAADLRGQALDKLWALSRSPFMAASEWVLCYPPFTCEKARAQTGSEDQTHS